MVAAAAVIHLVAAAATQVVAAAATKVVAATLVGILAGTPGIIIAAGIIPAMVGAAGCSWTWGFIQATTIPGDTLRITTNRP